MNPETNKTIPDFVNVVVGQVILSVFVLNTDTTKIKTENHLSIVKNSQTIIIGDLGLEKKIVITIDTIAIISGITIPDHILRILDSSIIEQTFSIDLDLKVLDQEIEISITDLMINITQIVRIRTTQLQITIINIGTEAILYPIEIKDHFHKTIIERDTKTDLTKTNSHPTITKQDLQVIQNHPPEKIEETETLKFNLVRTKSMAIIAITKAKNLL